MTTDASENVISTHTPGPWMAQVLIRDHGGWRDPTQHITVRAGDTLIVDCDTHFVGYPDDPVNAANAHLIAAAPDMFTAIKDAESCFDAMSEEGYLNDHRRAVWAAMRAAIAKATNG